MCAFASSCKYMFLPSVVFIGKGWHRSILYYYKNTVNELQRSSANIQFYKRTFHTCIRNVNRMCIVRHQLPFHTVFVSTSAFEVNTKVVKDVILYRYENPKFFRTVNIFALCQFGFWTYLSHFAFTTLKDAPVPKDKDSLPWWRRINLGENKYRNGLTVLSFLIGKQYLKMF